jgi:hypothetical protein
MEQALYSTLGTTESGGETIESTLSALSRICLLKYKVADQELTVLPKTDDQMLASNRYKRLWSKAKVVSVVEKA